MNKLHRLGIVFFTAWFGWHSMNAIVLADDPAVFMEEIILQQLVIPAIDLDNSIVPVGLRTTAVDGQTYSIWETAENDIGWHQGSGPPGHIGNTILAGHSNGGREIFRRLEEVEIGHEILLATNNGIYHYQVTDKLILREQGEPIEVRAANARWILPTEDERLTLVTCWPYPSSTHRLLVIAHPSTPEPLPGSQLQPVSELERQPVIPPLPAPALTTHSDPIFTPQTGQALQPTPDIHSDFELQQATSITTSTPNIQHQSHPHNVAAPSTRIIAPDLVINAHRLNDIKG